MDAVTTSIRLLRKQQFQKTYIKFRGHWCVYCREVANERDHVPNLAVVEDYAGVDRVLVPSCISCNKILNKSCATTIADRLETIRRKLQWQFKSFPVWTEAQLSEMSQTMGRQIRAKQRIMLYDYRRIEATKENIALLAMFEGISNIQAVETLLQRQVPDGASLGDEENSAACMEKSRAIEKMQLDANLRDQPYPFRYKK